MVLPGRLENRPVIAQLHAAAPVARDGLHRFNPAAAAKAQYQADVAPLSPDPCLAVDLAYGTMPTPANAPTQPTHQTLIQHLDPVTLEPLGGKGQMRTLEWRPDRDGGAVDVAYGEHATATGKPPTGFPPPLKPPGPSLPMPGNMPPPAPPTGIPGSLARPAVPIVDTPPGNDPVSVLDRQIATIQQQIARLLGRTDPQGRAQLVQAHAALEVLHLQRKIASAELEAKKHGRTLSADELARIYIEHLREMRRAVVRLGDAVVEHEPASKHAGDLLLARLAGMSIAAEHIARMADLVDDNGYGLSDDWRALSELISEMNEAIDDWRKPLSDRLTEWWSGGELGMNPAERLMAALERAIEYLPDQLKAKFKELLTPQTLMAIDAVLALHVVGHLFGGSQVIDGLLVAVGFLLLGKEALDVAEDLYDFLSLALNATSHEELDEAGRHFARAAATVASNLAITGAMKVGAKIAARAGAMRRVKLNGECFTAGTPLRTPDGERLIETLRPGDLVLSRDQHNSEGPTEPKVVEEVFVRLAPIMELVVGARLIRTTPEHPFFVRGRGWVCAKELTAGDRLCSEDGTTVAVERIADSGELATVYNVRVADFHTYFVGSRAWGFSVWAHNAEYIIVQEAGPGGKWRLAHEDGTPVTSPLGEIRADSLDDLIREVDKVAPTNPANVVRCFPPDTLVSTEAGLRPIAHVEAGERVWGYDFQSGVWRLCVVECRHDADYEGPLVTLDVGVGEVTATAYHPFWVVEGQDLESRPALRHVDVNEDRDKSLPGRWVNSHDLRGGDVVFLRDRGSVTVRRVMQRPERTPVCNLTVRGLHTFAVGDMQVLVHNMSGTSSQPPLRPLHPDSSLSPAKMGKYEKLSTQELIDSLKPGQQGSLKVRPDGTMIDGHHRIKILRDRGVNVDALPREVIPKDPLP